MSRNVRFILNIVIVVAVVALLGAGVYFLTRPEEGDSLGEMYTDDDKVKVFSYAEGELTGVDIVNEYGRYSLRREGQVWTMEGFEGETLNATSLDTLDFTFRNITSDSRVAQDPEDLSAYGLDSPSAVMTLTTTAGSRTFYIGDETPDGSGSYFNTDGSSDVYIMAGYQVDVVRLTARDYLTVAAGLAAEDMTAVTIRGPEGVLALSMDPAGPRDQYSLLSYWDITSPESRSASNSDVTDKLLTPISELENGVSGAMELNGENLTACGLDSPEYTVTVTAGGKDYTYEFSAVSGTYRYFRRSDVNYIMRADDEDCAFLRTTAYDVAEKLLAMIDIGLISEIHIEHEGETVNLDVVDGGGENPGFYHDGMQLDEDTFKDFYGHIVAVLVSGSLDSAPTGEEIGSIEYVLTGGESIKLVFTEYDERNYAVTVNGGDAYTVAKKTVEGIFDKVKDTFR